MANLPFFWQTWVTGLIVLGLIFLLVLVLRIYFAKDEHEDEIVWDGDLKEGSAPAPFWWFWLITIALFYSVIYMIFYPSYGNYNGLFNWTVAQNYAESQAKIDDEYYKKLTLLQTSDELSLKKNPQAMRLASNIYAQNCATCHGKDAQGQDIFPNLIDQDWLWGDKSEQITHSIAQGRKAIMPAWGAVLEDQAVNQIAAYVKSVSTKDGQNDTKKHADGKAKYQQFCLGCHASNLTGKTLLGAADLSDDIWLYGGDLDAIKHSIKFGRRGVMPAHKDRLDALQIKLLTAWLQKSRIKTR